ncbi:MAG: hypothetical protein K6B38_14495 [Ruminococcus sp.]|nr:hypothetical protein [Ruminococcus sp.]
MKKIIAAMLATAIITGGVIPANVSADEYEPYLCMGDTNGDKVIDGRDATDVLTFYAMSSVGNGFITQTQKMRIDVNCDSVVDGKDATDILSYYSFRSIGGVTQPDNYYMKNMLESGDTDSIKKAALNMYSLTTEYVREMSGYTRYNTNSKDTIIYNGNAYLRIADPRINNIDDIYAEYNSIFTDDSVIYYTNSTTPVDLLEGYFVSDDGVVYSHIGGRGDAIGYKYSQLTEIKSMTSDSVTFNVCSFYSYDRRNANFTLKIQPDGTLKVTEFTLPY